MFYLNYSLVHTIISLYVLFISYISFYVLYHHSMFSNTFSFVFFPPLCISCINGVPHAYKHVHTVLGFTWGLTFRKVYFRRMVCKHVFHLVRELNHQASRNQQSLRVRVPLLAPGPWNVGVSMLKLYLASGSYLRAMIALDSNPTNPSNGTSRWTND